MKALTMDPTSLDTNVFDTSKMNCFTVGVEVHPFPQPPPQPEKRAIPNKILAILKKYKYNWRLDQLSKPVRVSRKFVWKEEGPLGFEKPKEKKLDDELQFYSDNLAAPALKNITHNIKLYGKLNRTLNKNLKKNLKKSWNTIYNFYKNRERDKKFRQMRREAEQKKSTQPKTFARAAYLARPKRVYPPPPLPRSKLFENYDRLDVLASPKVCIVQPPKREGVNPAALTYQATETVLKLAKVPQRFVNIHKPLEPGAVSKAALRYKATPRIETLCVPKTTREKTKEDDDFDPWAIPKNALKYKATPRIMDLAKPKSL